MAAQQLRDVVGSQAGVQHPLVPVVSPTVGQRPQRVAQHAVGPLGLSSSVLVVHGTHHQHRTNCLGELAEELRGEFGIVINNCTSMSPLASSSHAGYTASKSSAKSGV